MKKFHRNPKEFAMRESTQLVQTLKALFSSQRLAILATEGKGQPYGNLVAFAATDDLKDLLFATTRSTRKYANLSGAPRAAMVIDNRTNQESDFHKAIAATATGIVKEVEDPKRETLLRLYLSKHPYLRDFVSSPTCALLRMNVETCYAVRQFQNVMELHIRE
jgi:nitroimidazol reductase NimA-like FMN-containing flavoprotein (pyridoxamine 5'-phosphate oxidase superfamily)